ncbi:MAG: peptidylprolyl isomerase [Candidatus Bathyarchaeia archaeon]|nr:peptidylprolyl isomerase [Candidatus Bathyarchaeota archaeon]
MPISVGDEVAVHYTVRLDTGEVIETTRDGEPPVFRIGSQELLPSLEEAMMGLEKGDRKEITVPPSEGFGEWREDLLQEVPESIFEDRPPKLGSLVELRSRDGRRLLATVHEVKEDSVILDLNHPLAGQTLIFDIEIMDIHKPPRREPDKGETRIRGKRGC